MEFQEKLYMLRKAANMTQTDLAEKLNVSRQAVSRWEMGTAKPEIDTLVAISELFGVTLDELLKEKNGQIQNSVQVGADEKQEQDLYDSFTDRVVNWMRVDMILLAIGIALVIQSYLLSSLFGIPFMSVLCKIGITLLILAIPLTIILTVVLRRYKKAGE